MDKENSTVVGDRINKQKNEKEIRCQEQYYKQIRLNTLYPKTKHGAFPKAENYEATKQATIHYKRLKP